MSERAGPFRALGRGILAGTAGTAAMTAAQSAVAKARGSEPSTTPAEVGKRIIRGVLERDVSDERTAELNQGMHWLYGTSWGALYGLAATRMRGSTLRRGAGFGLLVWATSLVELPAMKLSPPAWEMPPKEVGIDAGYHLVYGLAVALADAKLSD